MPRVASLSSKGLTSIGVGTAVVAPSIPTWVAATKGFPTTSIDVFSVTNGQLASSSSTLYSPLEANSVNDQFAISPENNFVYVPNGTKNRIEIIPVDLDTGIYTGSGVTSVSTSALGTYPSNITISPDGNYAYVMFANSFKIGIYSRNALTGALTGISNLRDGYTTAKITTNGAYLYTVLNNLIIYSRDISTGALTLVAEDTQAVTNGGFAKISLSKDNRSLYVADFAQNNFYVYTIDPATGLITLSQTINLSSFGADVRPNGVEVSNDGNYVYVTLYDINQVLGTTVVMYSRSLTAPFTLTQSNVYTISGAVGEQTANLILTKQQNLLIMSVSGSTGAPIHSWTRNTLNGRLTLNADVTGFGAGIATNTGILSVPIDLIVNGTFASPGFTSPFTQMPPGWFILGSNWDASSGYLQLGGSTNATSNTVAVVPGATYTYSVTVLPGYGSFFDDGNKINILHSTRVGGGGVLTATSFPIPSAGTYTGTWVAPLNATTVAVSLTTFSYTSFRADNVVFYKNA
jgi:sugar lactone lactonase YvrE